METQLLIDPHSAFGSPISFASNPMLPSSNQTLLPMMEDSNQTLIPVMEQMLPMMEANNPTMLPVMEASNQTLLPNPTLLPMIPSPIDLNCELSFAPVIPSSSSVNGEYIIPSMSEMNSGDQVPSSSLSPYEPDPDLTMCEVNSVDAFDCSVQQDLVDLSSVQQDLVDLSSVQPNLVDLSSTQEDLVDLSSTQEDLVNLSSTQEDLVDLSSTQEDLVDLSSTQEDLVDLSSAQEDLVDLSSAQEDLVDLSSAQEDFVSFSGLGVGQLSDGPMVTCAPVPPPGPGWPHPAHDTLSSVSSASGAFSPVETGLVPTLATHASGTFSPTESGLVAIPEDELLKDMEPVQPMMGPAVQIPPVIGPLGPAVQIPPMMVNNVQIPPVMGPLGPTNVQIPPMMGPTVQIPQIPDSNESDVASETNRTESASTAVSCSATLNSGYPQFERAEAMTAKQQVALWLTRTSTSDLQQEFSVPSLRSLVGPSKSSSHRWHKSRYRHMTGLISRTGSTPVKTIIKRNFSTKSLMERWSGSRDPIYCQEEPVMRKCKTTIALADIMGGSSHGHSHSHQAVPRRKKESRSTPQGSRRSLAFNRFSTEGIPFSNVGGCGLGTQRTAPGELYGLRHGQESPFPGIRPINRLRSQSTMTQCSRCNSVMSVHTPRTNSRATSQISLLLDRSRRRDQDEILCKICLMDYPSNLMVKLEDCGCTFCKECIQQYITFEVMEGAYEISCPDPDCLKQGILNQHQMERLTSKDLMDKHRTFRLNTEVSIDAARTWCPSAGCDTICHICLGAKSQGVPVCCPTCTKEFCSLCSATWHPGITCSENGALLVKRGGGEMEPMVFDNCDGNIKRCPVCNVPIERDAGCAQMMCKRCKHVFCWYCLTSLDDDFLLRHYDSGACKGRLGHSRASVLWHRAQVIGIFAGFGILLLVASPLLLVMAPCIICCKCRACSKPEEVSVEQATSDFSSKASIKST